MEDLHIVIMAGGVGSRFWPASREDKPKQFLDILNTGKSLIQMTWERFAQAIPADRIYISTHEKYRDLVKEHLPDVHSSNILMEPARRNTAPCLAYAALHIEAVNPGATILVVPSDHRILDEPTFIDTVSDAHAFAQANDAIMTLGMKATRPDTGYGYIKLGRQENDSSVYAVAEFTEKPNRPTAEKFIESENYVWNAGIFLFSVSTILKAFRTHAADVIEPLSKIKKHYGTAQEADLISEVYKACPSISFDYAIMEKVDNAYCIPTEIGWSDLGTWNSLYNELVDDDKNSNVLNKNAEVKLIDSEGNYVTLPNGKKAIIYGLNDYMVIDEGDVLLIWPRDKEQEIKSLKKEIAVKWNLD